MKTIFQRTKILCIVLSLCMTVVGCLTACSGGVNAEEAKAFIGDFYAAIAAEDYEKAATFLHPDRYIDLEPFFNGIEESEGVDFQAGITVKRYTGFSSSYYNSTVDGSRLELTILTTVGEDSVEFTVEIVQNDDGYGIYNLDIDL